MKMKTDSYQDSYFVLEFLPAIAKNDSISIATAFPLLYNITIQLQFSIKWGRAMNRDYLLLGVRKNASREQIKRAYERQLLKYRAPDYEDDPEYVRRKIDELNAAYNRMYKKAVSSSVGKDSAGNAGIITESQEQKSARHQKHRDYAKKRREMDEEELHLLDRLRKSGDKPKKDWKKRDSVMLKDKKDSLKARMKESIKEGNTMRAYEETENGEIADTLTGPAPKKTEESQGKMMFSAIGLIISLVVGLFTMCNSTDNSSFIGIDDGSSYIYELSDYSESDRAVYDEGQQVYADFSEMETAEQWSETAVTDAELETAADAFVKAYTEDPNIAALCDRLYQNYDPFIASGSDDVSYQIEEVLRFYGFPDYYEIEGKINPYNGDIISNLDMYLRYLVQHHEYSYEGQNV